MTPAREITVVRPAVPLRMRTSIPGMTESLSLTTVTFVWSGARWNRSGGENFRVMAR